MSHREFKDPLYEQFARIGHAVASPKRIELLDLLGQGPKTVEALAAATGTPVKSTSAHLRVLRQARLVETRRAGTYVHYRLADASVEHLLRALKGLAHARLAEVERVASLYLTRRDELEAVTLADLRRRLEEDSVTVLDVRPRDASEAGHVPGALSIPVDELEARLGELPPDREVIAYCRGPYCVFALEALGTLRASGRPARRTEDGLPEWRAAGWPVKEGAAP
jgi:rhodanese-related sulfurtransferase